MFYKKIPTTQTIVMLERIVIYCTQVMKMKSVVMDLMFGTVRDVLIVYT